MLELGGKISDEGKLSVYNQALLNDWRVNHAGSEVVLSLKVKRKTRSSPQNAYYWGVVIPLIKEAINKYGSEFDNDEAHEFLKARFNHVEIETVPDNFIEVPQSTSKLTTVEFITYIMSRQQLIIH